MKNECFVTGKTYRTYDYSVFKRLDGNRDVKNFRVNKIKRSIQQAGYVFNPIVVNEKMEVIDGQGRLEALRLLGLPVDFVIAEGAGISECIALNANTTTWSNRDYVDSFCELGFESYLILDELAQEYSDVRFNIITNISAGVACVQQKTIKEGNLHICKDNLGEIRRDLNVAKKACAIFKRVAGTKDYYIYATVFAVRSGADLNRIVSAVAKTELKPAPNVRIALLELSDIYNKGLKTPEKRLYLHEAYQKMNLDKYSWYQRKYMKNEGGIV